MKPRLVALLVALCAIAPAGARAAGGEPCVPTPRAPANPAFQAQEQAFGFHDEEIVICSPGWTSAVHIAARLWVPAGCPGARGCAGVVIAHGFGFSKELTFSDMFTAVRKKLYVLSYDVRGQGSSGGQAAFLGRDDIADQAAVLAWWHRNVHPTKTAFYGISQGGWLSWTAAVYNCGAARAARYDTSIPCDRGGRWIDAIAPMQGPTGSIDDGTCSLFELETFPETRFNPAFAQSMASCPSNGRPAPIPGTIVDVAHRMGRIDVPVYAVTSFFDRLVPARQVIAAYEQLHARALDRHDALYGKDVRLTMSNDGHGDVGGNTALVGDVFTWITHELTGGALLRVPTVSIAQAWAGNTFRLERGWPIPATTTRTLFLARGMLGRTSGGTPDELRNLPLQSETPSEPFIGTALETNNGNAVPDARLAYTTAPFTTATEITGEPWATIYVSSANAQSKGNGQLNIGLSELSPNGYAHEFSHARIGLIGLGTKPVAVRIPLSVSGHRIAAGSRLMLAIASSDLAEAIPAPGTDSFYVHHDAVAPSFITIPIVPIGRTAPPGQPPTGVSYTDNPVAAICTTLNLPC
jgi:ABC-2 type transport system ATP-binding protein